MEGKEWYGGQKVEFGVRISPNGIWKLDKVPGKSIVVIWLRSKETGEKLEYSLYHDELDEVVEKMLEAELKNDQFIFENPIRGKHRDTPQFYSKTKRCKGIIQEWEGRAERELKYRQPMLGEG